jgi:hypothetical protein
MPAPEVRTTRRHHPFPGAGRGRDRSATAEWLQLTGRVSAAREKAERLAVEFEELARGNARFSPRGPRWMRRYTGGEIVGVL